MKELSIATFNVRGIANENSRADLASDINRYGVDVCCLQETKVKKGCSEEYHNCKVECYKTTEDAYRLGFVINNKWSSNIHKHWKVSDRIAVLQLKHDKNSNNNAKTTTPVYTSTQLEGIKLQIRKESSLDDRSAVYSCRKSENGIRLQLKKVNTNETTFYTSRKMRKGLRLKLKRVRRKHLITIINCYSPYYGFDEEEISKFYDELENTVRKLRNTSSMLFVCGDLNASVGKRTDENCMGRYSKGVANPNGDRLKEFCESNEFLLTNTCFTHKQAHLTTWQQTRIVGDKTLIIRKTNDYIMMEQQYRHILKDSRSYQGTNTNSDHRLLVTRMKIDWPTVHSNKSKSAPKTEKYNTQLLVNDKNKQDEYKRKLKDKLLSNTSNNWDTVTKTIHDTAKNVIGTLKPTKRKIIKHNNEIESISKAQLQLRIEINNETNKDKIIELRSKRNLLLKKLKKTQKKIFQEEIESKLNEINKAENDHKFFKAVKYFRNPSKKKQSIIVHNKHGQSIANPDEKYKIVKQHFTEQFYDASKVNVEKYIGEPKPLNKRITPDEVTEVTKRLNNNKAAGNDGIPGELYKYAPPELHKIISESLNDALENHNNEINFGLSVLLPTPKPKKDPGPAKHLRPLNLLQMIRKTLSLITLNRINHKVNNYLSASQAAYRKDRSTTDIVWAHRFIIAKSMLYRDNPVNIIGLDMSSAFDTIDRAELISILETIVDEDELRMCRILLSDTTMKMRFDNHEEETFQTNKGSPQGDGISGTFFNISFENALRDLRSLLNELNIMIEHSYCKPKPSLPDELVYADDSDFPCIDDKKVKKIKDIANPTLSKHSLKVNEDKWEITKICRGTEDEEKAWRNTKKLGSLLGDNEDMKNRIALAKGLMSQLEKIWPSKKISQRQRIDIFKSIAKMMLTYNMSTWGLTKAQENHLDRAHRKMLRTVVRDKRMKNKPLYEHCNEKVLSIEMREARWRAFGHMLRLDREVPAQKAMDYYFDVPTNAKKYSGRRRSTLPVCIDNDLKETAKRTQIPVQKFATRQDLEQLRRLASDRVAWKALSKLIVAE